MAGPALSLLAEVATYNPTNSIVGNGITGQVSAQYLSGNYQWSIFTQELPGLVLTGEFPNEYNPVSIQRQNIGLSYPYRGGYNIAATAINRRPKTGPVGISAVGLYFFGPNLGVAVSGKNNTIWNINSVVADITGTDIYGGVTDSNGQYNYTTGKFIASDAWQNIPGFLGSYVQEDGHSKILGWAIDGYPIYGPFGYADPESNVSAVRKMTSGYQIDIKPTRPEDPIVYLKGNAQLTDTIRVKNPEVVGPGMRLRYPKWTTPVKVLQVNGDVVVLDRPVTLPNNVSLQGTWPLGIFIEDYSFGNPLGTLDIHNGRFCVTPEFPNGTYAYFLTVDADQLGVYPYVVGNTLHSDLLPTPFPPPEPLTWQTPDGLLGTLAQDSYFGQQLLATIPNGTVSYSLVAGSLPAGVQLTSTGVLSGVPTLSNEIPFGTNVESKFTVRALSTDSPQGRQFRDRTFILSIAASQLPDFETPAGNIGFYYDGGPMDPPIQLEFTGPLRSAVCRLAAGRLPPGVEITPEGKIQGFVGLNVLVDQPAGYQDTPYAEFGYDFLAAASNYNYQFTVEIIGNRQSNLRTFEIFVVSRNTLTADNTIITADDTVITADQSNDRVPFMITPAGDIGTVIDDNYYAFQFRGVDLDAQAIVYNLIIESGPGYNYSLPPGLTLDPRSGWLYGYIPNQGISKQVFNIAIQLSTLNDPTVVSPVYVFDLTVISGVDTRVNWVSPSLLGTIDNGYPSLFKIEALSVSGVTLQYKLKEGSKSLLPQGTSLLPSGHIAGNASFNTFALDNGTTTFDVTPVNGVSNPTTFDLTYTFTAVAYSSIVQQGDYEISGVTVQNQGSGYSASGPTVTIAPPPGNGAPATIASVSMIFLGGGNGYGIQSITMATNGFGYRTLPTITITGGGGSGAILVPQLTLLSNQFLISSEKTFTIKVNRRFNEPLDTLYVVAEPPEQDRDIVKSITQNQTLLPQESIFRPDDFNFGVSKKLEFVQAYGLNPDVSATYQRALELNHYWKNIIIGNIQTARAVDDAGNIVYEVIYCPIIDDLVNAQGQSVSKEIQWWEPIYHNDLPPIYYVYPNSLIDMRTQVIDTVGQISNILPLWMTSLQEDGRQIGYIPAWVIAYVKPGTAAKIAYDIQQFIQIGENSSKLKLIDWKVDRYELGREQSYNWDPIADSTGGAWVPAPSMTTFDSDKHYWPNTSDGSTEVFFGGVDYQVGSEIRVLGSALGGVDGVNDLNIFVYTVDNDGAIVNFYVTGVAGFLITAGTVFNNVSGTTIRGTGLGANFDIVVQDTANATTFDQGSLKFVSPSDRYNPGDIYNKYLVFPKRNILD